ncbi:hypothetical protein K438DRAFT_1758702 [Mycena galopus ATCC 62051]|nr:hypothetical protein K438DRAFT_1758702 [Mycena galopus ATCC 62051]
MPASSSTPVVLQQVLPVLLFFVLPYFALRFFAFARPKAGSAGMALGALLPWNWGTAHSGHEKEVGSVAELCGLESSLLRLPVSYGVARMLGGLMGRRLFPVEPHLPSDSIRYNVLAAQAQDGGESASRLSSALGCSFLEHFYNSLWGNDPPLLSCYAFRGLALAAACFLVDPKRGPRVPLRPPALPPRNPHPRRSPRRPHPRRRRPPRPPRRPQHLHPRPPRPAPPLRALALVEALCAPPPLLDSPSSSPFDSLSPSKSAPASVLTSAFWAARTSTAPTLNLGASAKATALLASHEHQNAQELFQLLSEAVRDESARLSPAPTPTQPQPQSPFDGLTATRRACVRCGYTAAIRHFAFDSVQLALEWGWNECCRTVALRATVRKLQEEIARLETPAAANGGGGADARMLLRCTVPLKDRGGSKIDSYMALVSAVSMRQGRRDGGTRRGSAQAAMLGWDAAVTRRNIRALGRPRAGSVSMTMSSNVFPSMTGAVGARSSMERQLDAVAGRTSNRNTAARQTTKPATSPPSPFQGLYLFASFPLLRAKLPAIPRLIDPFAIGIIVGRRHGERAPTGKGRDKLSPEFETLAGADHRHHRGCNSRLLHFYDRWG